MERVKRYVKVNNELRVDDGSSSILISLEKSNNETDSLLTFFTSKPYVSLDHNLQNVGKNILQLNIETDEQINFNEEGFRNGNIYNHNASFKFRKIKSVRSVLLNHDF